MESDAKPEAAAKPKLKRRWFQFSIASLLFLIAICAVVVAFVVNPARRQRRAVEYVKNLGGEVGYANIRAVAVHRVLGNGYFRPVDMVCLRGTQVSDAGLAHLKGMNALGWLDLTGTQVSDAGVMHLKELTTLEGLDLTRTQVSDAGVLELKGSFAQLQDIPLTPATMPLRRAAETLAAACGQRPAAAPY